MAGFEFSYMTPSESTSAIRELFALIDDFNRARPGVDVFVHQMTWGDAWQQLMRMAIYKKGPALSEIGSPWTNDFVAMNSLRPFQAAEIERLGGAAAFSPPAWKNVLTSGTSQVWGIPSRVDVRVIFYWKDLLETAGVDEEGAFATPERMADTLARLQACGMNRPLAIMTNSPRNNVYHAASWVWGAGGEIVDAEGNLAFRQPAAKAGLASFIGLHPYLSNGESADQAFLSRQAAVMIGGQWVVGQARKGQLVPSAAGMIDRLGVALPPGPSFVGGTNLVIWQHAGHAATQTALELIEAILTSPAYNNLCINSDYLPAGRAALCDPLLAEDPHYRVLVKAMQTGRSHRSAHLWVLVAERLGNAISTMWNLLQENPNQDVSALVARQTGLVAARLEQAMG